MKILICGGERETTSTLREAVYDAGCLPVGPSANALRALGLADQEQPGLAIIDLAAVDGGQGRWLAEQLAERGIALICLSEDRGVDAALAQREHTFIVKPTGRHAIVQCILARRRRHALSRSAKRLPAWSAVPGEAYRPAI